MTQRYTIVRLFQRSDLSADVIRTGVTLKQAQAHCQDPQTSSSTATNPTATARTAKYGAWFDAYRAE